ncbi:MAG: hypothetical protein U9N50_04510 [Pseudomonadota bacterium]|nr:hypothetical protein [Pseudomonadota bacterium]
MTAMRDVVMLTGVIVLGAVLSDSQFTLPAKPEVNEKTDAWQLPPLNDSSSQKKSYARLAKRYKPGATKPVAGGKNEGATSGWQLNGILLERGQYYALINFDKKLARYREGDELPDGVRLAGIEDDSIWIVEGEDKKQIRLYQRSEHAAVYDGVSRSQRHTQRQTQQRATQRPARQGRRQQERSRRQGDQQRNRQGGPQGGR